MMAPELGREAQQAIALIKTFSLELDQYSPESQVLYWLHQYRAPWIRDAIIEAIYQGRYKIISVHHLLSLWQRRGQPICHFTSGFEQVIAAQFGTPLHLSPSMLSQHTQSIGNFASRNVAQSKVSTEVEPIVNKVLANDSAVTGYGDDPGLLSIEAFPVEAENTLVEVYQASVPHRRLAYESNTIDRTMAGDEKATYRVIHTSPGESFPIQPFRPTPRREHMSRR